MEVVLRFGKENELSLWQQMELVASVESGIERRQLSTRLIQPPLFARLFPERLGLRGQLQKKLVIKKWENELHSLENANLVRRKLDENLWRISLRVAALNDIDYGEFLQSVKRNVDNQLWHFQPTRHVSRDDGRDSAGLSGSTSNSV